MAVNEVATVKSGGSDMQIFTSRPDGSGKSPAVIIIQEIFGVDAHIKQVTTRFSEQGYYAATPELYHREGPNKVVPYLEMKAGSAIRQKLTNDDILADLKATIEVLQNDPHVDADKIGIVGFCFGGFVTYLGSTLAEIKAAAIFYGGGILPRPDAPADAPRFLDKSADDVKAPIISFWGADDGGIPPATVREIASTLKDKGKSIEVTIYEGAGHGFFCNDRGSYNKEAANDAWPKTLAFFKTHLS